MLANTGKQSVSGESGSIHLFTVFTVFYGRHGLWGGGGDTS